jgi:hypothetical protein
LSSTIKAQDLCEGNFDCDLDVDGTDASVFKSDFGRSSLKNPCPDCVPACEYPAQVPKTGQTTSYATGDDGDLEKGVPWPNPRFTDNENGTVTDNLTGLIWLRNANCYGSRTWNEALNDCNGLNSGECGLTDGSGPGEWRLPNVNELLSLIDRNRFNPALPSGHPFTDVQSVPPYYWSSTTYTSNTVYAWYVNMEYGGVTFYLETYTFFVWPVRGGQ